MGSSAILTNPAAFESLLSGQCPGLPRCWGNSNYYYFRLFSISAQARANDESGSFNPGRVAQPPLTLKPAALVANSPSFLTCWTDQFRSPSLLTHKQSSAQRSPSVCRL